MINTKTKIMNSQAWYRQWHQQPNHSHIHWGAFAATSFVVAFFVVNAISNTYSEYSFFPIHKAKAAQTYYVDMNNPACSNTAGSGTITKPYCTLRYVTTIALPGDTFLFKNGRYNDPNKFTRSGTASAPITYKAIGTDVIIGSFDDVKDEDFVPTQYANVYSIPWTKTCCSNYRISQTHFSPILVRDPNNNSNFTMSESDGPLSLAVVPDFTTLTNIEGTWLYDTATSKIYIHAYDDRVLSLSSTDLVVGHLLNGSLIVESNVQYNIFDGFKIKYSGGTSSAPFIILGSNNKFYNLQFQAITWSLRGNNNYAENISITHVITRGETWLWDWHGGGTSMAIYGNNHLLKNLHFFHNWNSEVSTDNAGTGIVIDGIRAHGAPNHCGTGVGKITTVRNAVLYNCQDYIWMHDTQSTVLDHFVAFSGVSVDGETRVLGPIIVRNSILTGDFVWVRGLPEYCTWEKNSIVENNIFRTGATIERCADNRTYTITEYTARCAIGEFTDCVTFRNNIFVTDMRTVIKDGWWNSTMGDNWDASLVANSPAINAGMPSGATTDILGVSRPQGGAYDIGAYEYCTSNCSSPPQPILGDINLDHIVNSIDYSLLNSKWFTTDTTCDLNRDGLVNAIDFSMLNANWFKTW